MPRYTASEFQRLRDYALKRRAETAERICIGSCKSWDDYIRDVAYIKAMDDLESEMARITGTQENQDEKDV